mgnify:CR=1 FL=1
MPVFDLNKYQEPQRAAPVEKAPEESKVDSQKTEDQIEFRGPISNIYAEALYKTIPKVDVVSLESNATEIVAIKAFRKDDEPREDPVVYVNTDDNIEQNPNESFDQLRLALDSTKGTHKKRYVVLEGLDHHIGSRTALMVEYAQEHATHVFFDRNKFLRFVRNRYDFDQS